ncbi:MAG: amidase [Planctomycetes bacterium]|nr:amidase [Planctomycetota bacterium]
MSGFSDYDQYDGLGLGELVRKGEVSSAELVDEALARIDRVNPTINAVVTRFDALARGQAAAAPTSGPFAGVPLLLKDLLAHLEGTPLSSGSALRKGRISTFDSEIVKRFRRAGFVFTAKTNTPEFGIQPVTEPALWGATRNPYDPTRTCGGSSGGSAAAVAAGIVPIATGGDGGGSIRIPASCCGIFGLKPTRARTPGGPTIAEAWQGFAIQHVLTRTVRDSAAVLDAIAGPEPGAPYVAPAPSGPFLDEVTREPGKLKIAFSSKPVIPVPVNPECVAAVEEAAQLLRELGHEVVPDQPQVDGATFARRFALMLCGEVAAELRAAAAEAGRTPGASDVEPATWLLALLGEEYSAGVFAEAVRNLKLMGHGVAPFFGTYDAYLTPTLAQPPIEVGTLLPGGLEKTLLILLTRLKAGGALKAMGALDKLAQNAWRFTPFTTLFNVTGQPGMSVPLSWSASGLPLGVQVVGRFGDEATLLRLAGQLERARPWAQRRPRVWSGGASPLAV